MISPRRLLASLIVASFAAAAACDSDPFGPERSDLQINRNKWRERGYRDYSVTMTRDCFCVFTGPVTLTVRSDSVVAAVRVSDGAPTDATYLPTVNKLFDFIQTAIDDHTKTITVTYDAELGFPRVVVYDLESRPVDGGVTYALSNVTRISTNLQSR